MVFPGRAIADECCSLQKQDQPTHRRLLAQKIRENPE